jgi:nicotinamidase-related amidase
MVENLAYDPVAEAPRILAELAEFARPLELDVARAALLVVDMQNAFLHPEGAIYLPAAGTIIPVVKRLAAAFRAAGRPVFYTRHAEDPAGGNSGMMARWWGNASPLAGTFDAELIAELAPEPGDAVIPKIRYSAFVATDLAPRLRQAGVADLVLAGVMTNLCVETTARDAFMRDYRVAVVADACAAPTLAMHRAALLNLAYGFAVVTTADAACAAVAGV